MDLRQSTSNFAGKNASAHAGAFVKSIRDDVSMFLVTHTDSTHMSCVLSIHYTYEDAISYLTNYLDEQYEPNTSNKYRVVQKSRNLFEVYQNGWLGKYLVGKFQIICSDLPN